LLWRRARDAWGREVGAVRGVLASMLAMMRDGVTQSGVATDHVIGSFRNNFWKDYKTSESVEPDLLSQFLFSKKFYPSLVREAGRAKKSGKN
jgi:hypothetical protein